MIFLSEEFEMPFPSQSLQDNTDFRERTWMTEGTAMGFTKKKVAGPTAIF